MDSWADFWYPEYLPEGMELVFADETDHFLFYSNVSDDIEVRICEKSLNASITTDTEHTKVEEINVGVYKGYLVENLAGENKLAFWTTDDRVIQIEFSNLDDGEVREILNHLKYIK